MLELSLVDILLNIMEVLFIFFILSRFQTRRYAKAGSLLLVLTFACSGFLLTTFENMGFFPAIISTILTNALYVFFCWMYYGCSLPKAIIAGSCVNPLNMLSNVTALCIGELISGMPISVMITQETFFTGVIVFAKLLFLLLGLLSLKMIRRFISFELGKSQWNAVLLIASINIVLTQCFDAFFESRLTAGNLFYIFFFTLVSLFLVLRILWEINNLNSSRTKSQQDVQLFQHKKEQFQIMESVQRETISLHRDLEEIQHQVMQETTDTAALTILLKHTQDRLDENKFSFQTGNRLYDMILNNRMEVFTHEKIVVTTEIYTTDIANFYELDLYAAFCNLLDNAIENCQGAEKRIKIRIVSSMGMYHLIIRNTIADSVLEHNQQLNTSKEDHGSHGYGVINVKEFARKHHGGLQYSEKQGYFCAHLVLEESSKGDE